MNCRDFREIADTYLSDELLVETNHEVFQHLENCANCRQELAMRREVREKLRLALKTSPEFQLNSAFVTRLRSNLKDTAFQQNSWFSWKILTPVLASLLIVFGLVFFYQRNQIGYAAEISKKAVNRHENCGLKNVKHWEENAGKVSPEKIAFVKSLQDSETKILDAHDCKFEGKHFIHYVLNHKGKLISVLKIASETTTPANTNAEDSIICEREKGLQMSRFTVGENLVFVISDMSEAENLSIARKLSDNLQNKV